MNNKTSEVFFFLLRVGLWEEAGADLNIDLNLNEGVNWERVYQLAQEQSVQGIVLQGIEELRAKNLELSIPRILLLQWIGEVQVIEQRNKEMNVFIASLMEKMRAVDIYALLVKGQGIAQCYEKPLWRVSGDVDLLLNEKNYIKARKYVYSLSSGGKAERRYSKEWGLNIESWYVELHGTQRTGLSTRVDHVIDDVLKDVFIGKHARSWDNGGTQVFLPAPNEDVFLVFSHFVKHFYKEGGVSIRQLCDWCRLLWTYKDSLNHRVLETRIRNAGLITEWKTFGALAVAYLGIPVEAMPLYSVDKKWSKKAERIVAFILKGGKWHRFKDTFRVGSIFPLNTLRFLPGIILGVNWLKIKERIFKW